tara:strand:- start:2172 stop:2627 length:456 start_codon:yes stop_codon:yes gene_type:complete
MANISTYPTVLPASGDLLLITDTSGSSNPTRNATVASVAAFANSYSLGYTVYTALINQAGTAAPSATVLQNTTGGTVTWSRTGPGVYIAEISGTTYPFSKTAVFLGNTNAHNTVSAKATTTTKVGFEQIRNADDTNVDTLSTVSIEIRIYT